MITNIKHAFLFLIVILIIALSILILYFYQTKRQSQINVVNSGTQSIETIKTNQWYSNIYKNFPTEPLFAFPLAFKLTNDGLSVSDPKVTASKDTIFSSFVSDFTIGIPNVSFTKSKILAVGDWNINLSLTNNREQMKFFLSQGIPYTNISSSNQQFELKFNDQIKDSRPLKTSTLQGMVLKIRDVNYIFLFPLKAKLQKNQNILILQDADFLFAGVLPKNTDPSLYYPLAGINITNTIFSYNIENNLLKLSYNFFTNKKVQLLVALFPHQFDNLSQQNKPISEFATLRGGMKLIRANEFSIQKELIIPPITFSDFDNSKKAEFILTLKKEVKDIESEKEPTSTDYFLGTYLGRLTSILQLTNVFKLEQEEVIMKTKISKILFQVKDDFIYDQTQKMFVSKKPEFGNEMGNDHHFHYGYFIRAASIMSLLDEKFKKEMPEYINEMVLDIATDNRQSDKYPFLRNFNSYEGHSFADGYANFGDGNDQESSSEAMNAWYSLYLYGTATNNQKLISDSLMLYNLEALSINYYWFDKNGLYAKNQPYNHAIASIIWGGKVDFATWFSGKVNMIYGIQLLPITPGSIYLKYITNFAQYKQEYLANGGNLKDQWGDLFVIWESFTDGSQALKDEVYISSFEGSLSESLFKYFILKNSN